MNFCTFMALIALVIILWFRLHSITQQELPLFNALDREITQKELLFFKERK